MDGLKSLYRAWVALPWYLDPVLYLAVVCAVASLVLLWRSNFPSPKRTMTKEEWKAYKAKRDLKIMREAQDQMKQRAEARAARKAERAAARVALPSHLQTNGTDVKTGTNSVESAGAGNSYLWGAPIPPHGYRDLRLLDSGGFADVYFARDSGGSPVAIKRLRMSANHGELYRKYFRREVRLLSELKSEAIPRLIEHHLEQDPPYFVMEYIDGENLATRVMKSGPLTDKTELVDLAWATGRALKEIHQKGFLHRDIKPSNVMLSSSGVKLIDLGIGKDTASLSTPTQLTAGTLAFSAPEAVTSGKVTLSSDIFAWGATIGFAMTGQMPYGDSVGSELLMRVSRGELDIRFLEIIKSMAEKDEAVGLLAREVSRAIRLDPASRPEGFK